MRELWWMSDMTSLLFPLFLLNLWPPYGIFLSGMATMASLYFLGHDLVQYRKERRQEQRSRVVR